MADPGAKVLMLFDGDCGICTAFAEFADRLDIRKQFEILPYQSYPENQLRFWGINYRDCAEKLQVLTPQGKARGGAFGMNYFFFQYYPWKLLVILIYAIPIFLLLEILVYAWVARNRLRLSKWFGLKACLRS